MSTTSDESRSVSRRTFIGACGAVAAGAGLSLPAVALGGEGRRWVDVAAAHVEAMRRAYLQEVERFAETLRPRFESGELRAYRNGDEEDRDGVHPVMLDAEQYRQLPHPKLEALCAAHFGLETTEGYDPEGDAPAAYQILAASPHAEVLDGDGYCHSCHHAICAVAWDVLAVARARGWYTPTPDESEDPLWAEVPCEDCGHPVYAHEEKGCGGFGQEDCTCKRVHMRHVPGFVA